MGIARKVVKRTTKRSVGACSCFHKNPQLVEWESELEHDAIDIFRFHPDVTFIDSQTRWFEYLDEDNVTHKHCPDLYLVFKGHPLWIEVKSSDHVHEFENRTLLLRKIFKRENASYAVLDDTVIRIQPRLANIKLLLKYQRLPLQSTQIAEVQKLFSSRPALTISELLRNTAWVTLASVYALLCNHILQTDMHTPLGAHSVLSLFKSVQEVISDEEIFG